MSTVQVLSPNGRRQNVKVTPNTKILQILEEVCQKQGFMPPEDYKLVHGRKALDITLSLRYANLPNNAKLELVKSETSRAEQDVLIALQLENGERLQNKFSPSVSLWEILSHWEVSSPDIKLTHVETSHNPPVQPLCIYMREEVIGELALQDMTLRKLGLTGGKAAIRYARRPVDDGLMAEIIDKIEKEKTKKAKLEQMAAKQMSQSETKPETCSENRSEENTNITQSDCKLSSSGHSNSMEVDSALETKDHNIQQIPMEVDKSQSDNRLDNIDNMSSNLPSNNSAVSGSSDIQQSSQAAAASSESSIEKLKALNIPGLQVFTPQDFHDLSAEEQRVARRLASEYMAQMGMVPPSQLTQQNISKAKKHKSVQSNQRPFADFKFPEESKGQDLYQNEFSEVNREEFKPCDRETVLFDLDEPISSSTANEELPDDFFEVTENDVKKMMRGLHQNLESMEEQPLMTQSMRLLQLEQKYGHYERVVVRVQFPDKMVLQGLFKPKETVFAITKFVKEYLEDKDAAFYLYTAPPKFVLKDPTKSLIEARLVPASIVYFGSDTPKDHYLSEAVLKEISKRTKADEIVSMHLSKSEDTSTSQGNVKTASKPSSGVAKSSSSAAGYSGSSTAKPVSNQTQNSAKKDDGKYPPGAPKWLKLVKK